MKRREFLSLSAIAVASAPGCAHLPPPVADRAALDAVTDVLDQLAHNVRAPFRAGTARSVDETLLAGAMEDVWSGLAVYSAFLELPLAHQVHPGVQRRIVGAIRTFWRGAVSLRGLLGQADDSLWARLEAARAQLGAHGDLVEQAELEARRLGVRGLGRRRFHALLKRATAMLRHHTPRALTEQLSGELDRVAAGAGLAPDPAILDGETLARVEEAHRAWADAGVAPLATCDAPDEDDRRVLTILGVGFVIIGTIALVVGIALMVAAPECICIGGIVALIGVGLLIPGIIMWANAATPAPPTADVVPAPG